MAVGDSLLSRPGTFLLLNLSMGAGAVALAMFGTLVPLFAVATGVPAALVGVLVALPNVLPMVLAVVAGRWVDAGGPARWLVIGASGTLLAPLTLVLFPAAWALAAAQVVMGLFRLFSTLAAQAYVSALANGRSHERNFSLFTTGLSAGRMIGPVLAGVVVDGAGFRAAFLVMLLVCAASAAMIWFIRGGVRGDGAARALPGGSRAGVRAALANVGVQLAILSSAGVFVAVSVRQAFLPVVLSDLGKSATTIGALVSFGALVAVLIRPLMPLLTRSLGGTARTLVVAMAAVALGVGLLGVVKSVPAFGLLAVVVGFGTGVGMPLSIVTVASHVDVRQRGLALGLRLSLNRSAQLVMPVLIGLVIGFAGFAVGFGLAGALLGALALLARARVAAFERFSAQSEAQGEAEAGPGAAQ